MKGPTVTIDVDSEAHRIAQLDQLQAEVRRREDMFLLGDPDLRELNEYAIAEWAQGLLDRQKEAMLAVVERAMAAREQG